MSTSTRSKVMVIDGHSMAFRAFYALPPESFVNEAGQHTNAVHGFTSMLLTMVRQHQPTHIAVGFDLSTPTFRSQEYEEYKGGREKTPEEFRGQIGYIKKVLETLNVKWMELDGFEADDIIATVAAHGEAADAEVLVVSGDRDTFQLISENTTVLYPTKGISEIPPRTAQDIFDRYEVWPNRYRHLAALVGEAADNLPGVPKVGPKTAAKWITQFGGVPEILENAESIKGKVGENLRAHVSDVERNFRLNELKRDLDLPYTFEQMERTEPDLDAMDELFDELEFRTLRERVRKELLGEQAAPVPAREFPVPAAVESAADLQELLGTDGTPVAVNLEFDHRAHDVLALATPEARFCLVLTDLAPDVESALRSFLLTRASDLLVSDQKTLVRALKNLGYELPDLARDLALEAFVLQPGAKSYAPEALAGMFADHDFGAKPKKPTAASLKKESAEDAAKNIQASCDRFSQAAWLMHESALALQSELLEHSWAAEIVESLEKPLSHVLLGMEQVGIAVDLQRLDALEQRFQEEISRAQQGAENVLGKPVTLTSPKQLQTVLFEDLDLPKTRKIASGYTTDAEALSDLMLKLESGTDGYEFMAHLLRFREFTKLQQFVTLLKNSVAGDQRVRTTYSQTAAATGRLSSVDPNLQNIPVRTEEGRMIRAAFVAQEGYEGLITADYSQIEMRIMAHLSGDQALIDAFNSGEDLHSYVGSQVFGVEPDEVTAAQRSKVKAMSYGLAYGLSSFGLSKQLKISVDEARTLMKNYFQRFGGVRAYLRGVVEQAREDGFTQTTVGRRRYLPDLHSSERVRRDNAERIALNSPIQGTAADIIKKAMLLVDAALRTQGLKSRMLLQVHDELVLEVAAGERERVEKLLRECMGSAAQLSVPLDVNVGFGGDWDEAAH